jgi:Arc/MetJ-type ribon-helix-helix transcriptional regulator
MNGQTVATSVRLPEDIQRAAKEAVANGLAGSITELVVDGLRERLVVLAVENQQYASKADALAALEEHFAEYPEARPTLAGLARAAAEMYHHPAVDHLDLIEAAVADLDDDAHFEDVLVWVQGALWQQRAVA